jgi:hypothetical protein
MSVVSYPYNEVRVQTHEDGWVSVKFIVDQDYVDASEADIASAIAAYLTTLPNATNLAKINHSQAIIDTNI